VTFSVWNIFALLVKFSFLLVHVLRNHWYVRGIVIWPILTMIPGSRARSQKHVMGVQSTNKLERFILKTVT
jgi:hypothetical protein